MSNEVQHVFVLMLENRSFDHMLGFSDIEGTDAVTGKRTETNGLAPGAFSMRKVARSWQSNSLDAIVAKTGTPTPPPATSMRNLLTSNVFEGRSYKSGPPADYAMPVDPSHEFQDVLTQLCGPGASYAPGGPYPNITNSGFVTSYAAAAGRGNVGEIMKCYSESQLPVINALAKEFAVSDNWFASMPGPTWPNRFFVHAGSSGGLDHSPSSLEVVIWETLDGFDFENGTIFDRMNAQHIRWRVYAGDDFPAVAGLKGIQLTDIHAYANFAADVSKPGFAVSYTFIEPQYNALSSYRCGTSQHPLDDVTRGEGLIKHLYEAIRNSPIWTSSLTIVTWDEHGGFYDHVDPPAAISPGDRALDDSNNQSGFTFEQYGPRVPALLISPLIPRNTIDHRIYDHASIPATLEVIFGLSAMTQRDARANSLTSLLTLPRARSDAPTVVPVPVASGIGGCSPALFDDTVGVQAAQYEASTVSRPLDSLNEGNVPGFLESVLRFDLEMARPEDRQKVLARFRALRTRGDAMAYANEVRSKLRSSRPKSHDRRE